MSKHLIKFETANDHLDATPIPDSWILEGKPVARTKLLPGSTDGSANTYLWECTAGRFNWHYEFNETAYVIEGSVIVKDRNGVARALKGGDTVFFPAGSSAEWTIERYILKVAFLQVPLPWPLMIANRIWRACKRSFRAGTATSLQG